MVTVVETRMPELSRGAGVLFADSARMRVHMVGIGGAGMIAAAGLLRAMGSLVSGSDLSPFEGLGALVGSGVRVSIGHHESQLDADVELVVASAAVPESNSEINIARRRGIPVIKYAELLGSLMALREGVAISGTHGKSTTTGLTAHLFREAGLSPSFIIGARSDQLGGSSGLGIGRHLIVESCEFNRSFLQFRPYLAAILNIEPDHLDCYRDIEEITEAFTEFARRVHPGGLLVCNADAPRSMRAAQAAPCAVQTFGLEHEADWTVKNLRCDGGRYAFDACFNGAMMLRGRLSIPGKHNVSNALAALALAYQANADLDKVAAALSTYTGVDRRLSWKGAGRGITVLDDYAHHPTEIRVTIDAARSCYPSNRLWVVFQPHQVSRTRHLMSEFAESFGRADEIVVPDVYCAREADAQAGREGSQELVSRICKAGGRAAYVPELPCVADHVAKRLVAGDLVMTMGAGDVWKVADELVERFCGPGDLRRTARDQYVVPVGGSSTVPVPAA
jgi:UDP-N-acetylmuramate--alanine ligase